MSTVGSAEERAANENYRARLRETGSVLGDNPFTTLKLAEDVPGFNGDTKAAKEWATRAVSAGDITWAGQGHPNGTFKLRNPPAPKAAEPPAPTLRPVEAVHTNGTTARETPSVAAPTKVPAPLTARTDHDRGFVPFDPELRTFIISLMAHLAGGSNYISFEAFMTSLGSFAGWGGFENRKAVVALFRLYVEFDLIEEGNGGRGGKQYRIAAYGAIEHLGWSKEYCETLKLKPCPTREGSAVDSQPATPEPFQPSAPKQAVEELTAPQPPTEPPATTTITETPLSPTLPVPINRPGMSYTSLAKRVEVQIIVLTVIFKAAGRNWIKITDVAGLLKAQPGWQNQPDLGLSRFIGMFITAQLLDEKGRFSDRKLCLTAAALELISEEPSTEAAAPAEPPPPTEPEPPAPPAAEPVAESEAEPVVAPSPLPVEVTPAPVVAVTTDSELERIRAELTKAQREGADLRKIIIKIGVARLREALSGIPVEFWLDIAAEAAETR